MVEAALLELPWYTELDLIWHSNPAMAAVTHSSKPGVDHASALYALVQQRGGAGPPTNSGATPQCSPHVPAYPQHDMHLHHSPPPSQRSQYNSPGPAPYHATSTHGPASSSVPAPSHTAPCTTSPRFHLPGLPAAGNVDDSNADDENLDDESGGWLGAQGEEDDDMIVDETADSLSHAAGKKRQLPSSPSPPPDVPEPFHIPEKPSTSSYNSRSAFGAQKPLSRGGRRKLPSEISRSPSTPSSTTRNTTSASDYFMSPTPQTSRPTSASTGSKKKKAKSDVMEQVDQVKDEIQSMHSDAMSRYDHKHKRFIAKLDAKTEHNRDVKRYEWLRANREHEVSQAAVNHQRLQEANDAEIRLRETDIRVHEAHSLVLEKEAETLRLKIQFQQMMQANNPPSGGAG